MGFYLIDAIKNATIIPLDVHLAVMEPDKYLEYLAKIGVDIVSIHIDATRHIYRTVEKIKMLGMKPAVAISPATPISSIKHILKEVEMVLMMTVEPGFAGQKFIPETIEKIRELNIMLNEKKLYPMIEVDGNINSTTVPYVVKAGANVLVAGTSSVFKGEEVDYEKKVNELRMLGERYYRK